MHAYMLPRCVRDAADCSALHSAIRPGGAQRHDCEIAIIADTNFILQAWGLPGGRHLLYISEAIMGVLLQVDVSQTKGSLQFSAPRPLDCPRPTASHKS